MKKPYFQKMKDDPAPLRCRVKRRVRFEEVDALGIVWHGRYPSYFEDARAALGEKYGVGYLDFYEHKVIAPIKKMHIDYNQSLKFQEDFCIDAIMHWSEAARINHEYIIYNSDGEEITTGYTVQVMLDMDNNLLMVSPTFYKEFLEKWKKGELE